jgi:large subunit ribosomal protein L4
MPKVALYNINGEVIGDINLNDDIFGIEVNEHVLHSAVVMQLASRRQGTSSTKSRGEVAGGGKKPWRQKGTGRARAGTIRSPLWRGGAITFGPKPRSYKYSLPKKVRRLALKSALASKVQTGNIIVVDNLELNQPKTKDMVKILTSLKVDRKALVVTNDNENIILSSRNIPGVFPMGPTDLNVYDILAYDKLVITKEAIAKVEEVLA